MTFAEELYFSLEQYIPSLELLVPFLLLSMVVAIILKKSKIFTSRASTLMGVIMGAALVAPHALGKYPPCYDLVVIINESITTLGLVFLGILIFMIVLGFVGLKPKFETFSGFIAFLLMGLVFFTFLSAGKVDPYCPRYDIDLAEFMLIWGIIAGILWGLGKLLGGGSAPRRPHPTPYHP